MQDNLFKQKDRGLQFIGGLQIFGGVLGLVMLFFFWYYDNVKMIYKPYSILTLVYTFGLCLMSIYAGIKLLQDEAQGFKLSLFVELLQILSFSIMEFTYSVYLGLGFLVTVGDILMDGFIHLGFFRIGSFYNKEKSLTVGINFIALFIFLYLKKKWEKRSGKIILFQIKTIHVVIFLGVFYVIGFLFNIFSSDMAFKYKDKYASSWSYICNEDKEEVEIYFFDMIEQDNSLYQDPWIPARKVVIKVLDSDEHLITSKTVESRITEFTMPVNEQPNDYFFVLDIYTYWGSVYTKVIKNYSGDYCVDYIYD